MPSSLQCAKKGLHRFQPVQYRWFEPRPAVRLFGLQIAPVSTPVQYRWFLSEPPIRNALEQGCTGFNAGAVPLVFSALLSKFQCSTSCTGFNAGAVPLVSERAANPQCTGTGLHRFQPVQYRWFAFEIASSSRRTVVAPVSTGAVEKAWRALTFHPASFLSSAGRGRRRGGWRERTLATPHAMVTQVRAHCAIRVFNQALRSIAAGPGWGPAPTLR